MITITDRFAVVRSDPDGNAFLDVDSIAVFADAALNRARTAGRQRRHWHAANPVTRIVRVTISEGATVRQVG